MSPPHATGASLCHHPPPGVPPSCPAPLPLFTALGCGTDWEQRGAPRVTRGTGWAWGHQFCVTVLSVCPPPWSHRVLSLSQSRCPPLAVSQLDVTTSPHLWHNLCDPSCHHVLPMKHSLCPPPQWPTVCVSPCPRRALRADAARALSQLSLSAVSPQSMKSGQCPNCRCVPTSRCHCPRAPPGHKEQAVLPGVRGQCPTVPMPSPQCPHVPSGHKE